MDLMESIEKGIEAGGKTSEYARKYKEELLGSTVIVAAPDEYWEIGLVREMGISLNVWREMDAEDRGKYRAQAQLDSMAEILKQSKKLQEEKMKKYAKGPH